MEREVCFRGTQLRSQGRPRTCRPGPLLGAGVPGCLQPFRGSLRESGVTVSAHLCTLAVFFLTVSQSLLLFSKLFDSGRMLELILVHHRPIARVPSRTGNR